MSLPRPATGTLLGVIAIAIALGGTAYATATVGTAQLKDDAVTSRKIRDGQVTARDLAHGAVGTLDLAPNAVTRTRLATASVTALKLAPDAVDGTKIRDGSIAASDVAAGSFVRGDGLSQANAGTLASGRTDYRMLSLGGVDIFANCTAQKLTTYAKAFVHDLAIVDEVDFDGQAPHVAAGVLDLGGVVGFQASSAASIGLVRWQASWTDADGPHVRTAESRTSRPAAAAASAPAASRSVDPRGVPSPPAGG